MPLQGDASTRAYERLVKPTGETAILMISPPRPDGPPVRRGKPYSAIAKLAETRSRLRRHGRGPARRSGFSAPEIYGEDLEAGPPASSRISAASRWSTREGPIPERYAEATAAAGEAARRRRCRSVLPVAEGTRARAAALRPRSPADRGRAPARLVCAAHHRHASVGLGAGRVRQSLDASAWTRSSPGRTTWTLRDYHSPNLIWLPDREGLAARRAHRFPGRRAWGLRPTTWPRSCRTPA